MTHPEDGSRLSTHQRVMVFDGVCHLCSGGARWVEKRTIIPPFTLVPMQTPLGRELLQRCGYDPDDPTTFLVIDGNRTLVQSDAWIHLVAAAGGAWRLVYLARIIPRSLRDALYRFIARHRYRWFGRRVSCYVPRALEDAAVSRQESSPPQTPRRPGP